MYIDIYNRNISTHNISSLILFKIRLEKTLKAKRSRVGYTANRSNIKIKLVSNFKARNIGI